MHPQLRRALCYCLSLMLAFAAVMEVFSLVTMTTLASDEYTTRRLQQYSDEMLGEIDAKLTEVFAEETVPAQAVISSITQKETDEIFSTISKNLIVGSDTDFSENDVLYNGFFSGINKWYDTHPEEEKPSVESIGNHASLAVHSVNEVFAESETASIRLYKLTHNNLMTLLAAACVVLILASVVLLDVLNKGRHNKFGWMGMGLVTAGDTLVILPLFLMFRHFVEKQTFCSVGFIQKAISDILRIDLKTYPVYGAALIFSGAMMLFLTYSYYTKKGVRAQKELELHKNLRSEYMQQYEAVVGTLPSVDDEEDTFIFD